jgi:Alcohol dehydrogenase GroES-like domain
MKAIRVHSYGQPPRLDDVPEPQPTGPEDVIVRIGGAGLCRTDLHIIDGWFADVIPSDLPVVLGHENAGWVHAVGPAVEHLAVGDPAICHPNLTCGVCRACRSGDDMRASGAEPARPDGHRRHGRAVQDHRASRRQAPRRRRGSTSRRARRRRPDRVPRGQESRPRWARVHPLSPWAPAGWATSASSASRQ